MRNLRELVDSCLAIGVLSSSEVEEGGRERLPSWWAREIFKWRAASIIKPEVGYCLATDNR